MCAATEYLGTLGVRFGEAWNRFWFKRVDPLPLCAIRVLTGVVSIFWYLGYSIDLHRLFGPNGLLTADVVAQGRTAYGFSAFDYATSASSLWTMYWLGAAVLVAFTLGLFTRVTSVLALLVTLSLIWRAPILAGPTEDMLTMLMLYLCLGPAGAYLSIDHWLKAKQQAADKRIQGATEPKLSWAANIALRLIQVHLTGIYVMMVLAKVRGDVWWSGMAVWWLIASPDARAVNLSGLRDWTRMLNLWTHAIMLFEACFVFLVWNRLARPLMLGLSVVMWLSLALITGELLFALLMLTANVAFLSAEALRRSPQRH